MQRLLLCIIMIVLLAGCQKEVGEQRSWGGYAKVRRALYDSMAREDYTRLNFSRIVRYEANGQTFLRVPYQDNKWAEQFVLVDVQEDGRINSGRIIQVKATKDTGTFEGHLIVRSLNGSVQFNADIVNGYLQDATAARTMVHDPNILPEVVLHASYPPSGGISWSSWMLLTSLFEGGRNYMGFYFDLNSGGGGGGGGGSGNGGTGTGYGGYGGNTMPASTEPVYYTGGETLPLEFDPHDLKEGIEGDIEKYIKCFTDIPDAGSSCYVAIYTDIPVDGDPYKTFNYTTGSPGHAYVRITKTNGSQTDTQYFGLYPESGKKATVTMAPIPGKIVDNSGHEYNGRIMLSITPDMLAGSFAYLRQMAVNPPYLIDRYNCADFALNFWNRTVNTNNMFTIPPMHIPGSMVAGSNTPQGLYLKMQEFQQANHPLATDMQLNVDHLSQNGTGPCN